MQTLMVFSESSPSTLVTASSSMPLTMAAWRWATESNHPQRRARPVVALNSRPMPCSRSLISAFPSAAALAHGWCRPWHAHHAVHAVGRHAGSGTGATGGGAGRRHVRIRAVVDVEEGPLGALKRTLAHRRVASWRNNTVL